MEEKDLKRLHECEMEILDELVKFCKDNNIKYFLTGGSALGAIRHNGFIPWDDDIDIAMNRKDYEYLIKNYKDNDKFYLQCMEKDEKYWNFFAKLRMKNTLMEDEKLIGFDLPKEIYVDIFPIDNAPSGGYKKIVINANLIRIGHSALWLKHKLIKGSDCKRFKIASCFVSILPEKKIYKYTKKIMTSYKNDKSNYVVDYLSPYPIVREYLPRSTYYDTVEHEFEDRIYMIPADADKYLTSVYGDYMTLPPVEKRVTHNIGRISFDTTKDDINK